MTMNNTEVHKVLRRAAKTALSEWYPGQYNLQEQGLEALIHDLWVWYLESPSVREKLASSDPALRHTLAVKAGLRKLAGEALQADTFNGKTLYSSEAVKDALKGRSTNKYLLNVLPLALEAVQHKDDQTPGRGYAESLRSRYEDRVIPQTKQEENKLVYAHKAITDEINVLYLTTESEGVGSSSAVFPGVRRRSGGHSDPTGALAILLLENPEIEEDYLVKTDWSQVMYGADSQPAYTQPDGSKVRPTGWEAWLLKEVPALVDLYLSVSRERAA